ncbi:sulfotransferase family protein [Limnohabitans planktonicus]|uniref:Sulfotransferase domain-containing protein n=1 Tax=Limnohabitans planktonicus II-D5 TaxID=1293045 RepID=A0A2T7UB25_9BURK|nr:sulfotransferase [Limnohabitans planktonicus]PVE41831.1 hypothetical protein H663_015320 [Limnohabitans planktonicus II-D5]
MISKQLKPIVDFLIAGAQKAGTTTLHSALSHHPDLYLSTPKEIHFFDNDAAFASDLPDYSFYDAHFSKATARQQCGEATPAYIFHAQAAHRIKAYNPGMKWLVSLRNPIDRAFSHWNMERSRGKENLTFRQAIFAEKDRTRDALPLQEMRFSYTARGHYSQQLHRLYSLFPRDQILVFRFERLAHDPEGLLAEIHRFLGITVSLQKSIPKMHALPYVAPLSDEDHCLLIDIFESELLNLEALTGWNCDTWRRPFPRISDALP